MTFGALFRRRAKIPVDMEALTALENLHLFKDGKMSHAGAWLLALDIRKFNISADVACALFLGTDKVRILDRRGFSSDVYSRIDEVVAYILSKINIAYIINPRRNVSMKMRQGNRQEMFFAAGEFSLCLCGEPWILNRDAPRPNAPNAPWSDPKGYAPTLLTR